MGSRTNFGISFYHHDDLTNTTTIMPSLSMKYFYPQNVQKAIIDNVKIDIHAALWDVSGWEGDDSRHTAQEHLPTVLLMQGSGSTKGSFVVNYVIGENGVRYYRVFPFFAYRKINIAALGKELWAEAKSEREPTKGEQEFIRALL